MFGLSKIYENAFKPRDDGYSIQTMRGLKFISKKHKNELVASYRNVVKFDIVKIMKTSLFMVALIIPLVLIQIVFSLPKSILDMSIYFLAACCGLIFVKPMWDHYRLQGRIYSSSVTLHQTKNWLERFEAYWSQITWMRIVIVLPIFAIIFYYLVDLTLTQPFNFLVFLIMLTFGAGLINLLMATFWKIAHHYRS